MATFLDVAGLQQFSDFFVFIFVWLAVYVILTNTKAFGQNKSINAIIGFIIALFVLFSTLATGIIKYIAPWFAVIFIFAVFIGIAFQLFGASGTTFTSLKNITFVIIALVFIIGALHYIKTKTVQNVSYLFHPTLLGVIFIFVIAIFMIAFLTQEKV